VPQAGRVGERARLGIENLKKGVERAAESVLGDDSEDLRLAQRQLDDLAKQLGREIAEGQSADMQTNRSTAPGDRNSAKASSADPNAGAPQSAQAQSPSQQGGGTPQSGDGQPIAQASDSQQGSSLQQSGSAQTPGGQPGAATGSEPGNAATQTENQGQGNSLAGQGKGAQRGGTRPAARDGAPGGGANGGDPVEANVTAGTGPGSRNWNWNQLLTDSAQRQNDPITGENFASWSDRLREVEELVDAPDLRDDVAKARERARLFRQEFTRERKKPDWAVVQLQVMKPLTEVRDRIADELARRESREALVPLDRDPVPNRYSDLVRRYYEELGKQK